MVWDATSWLISAGSSEMVAYGAPPIVSCFFFFQAEDGIRDSSVTGVQTCALPISWLTPFCAVNVMANVPDAVGVPLSVPVPLPLLRNVTPAGKAPFSVMLGVGNPLVVTLNVPAAPTWKVTAFALVNAGA